MEIGDIVYFKGFRNNDYRGIVMNDGYLLDPIFSIAYAYEVYWFEDKKIEEVNSNYLELVEK